MVSTIEEAGGRLLVLKMAGEGATGRRIRDELRDRKICDVAVQTVYDYLNSIRSDPDMQQAIKLAAQKYVDQGANLITETTYQQLTRFRELVTTVLNKYEPILSEADGNLTTFLPLREDENPISYKARLETVKAMLENLPKLDARLESWVKLFGSLHRVGAFNHPTAQDPRGGAPTLTVNITNITMQYQRVMLDFLSWLPSDKQEMFKQRLGEIAASQPKEIVVPE